MDNLSYIEAWSRWLSGETVSNYLLWQVQILWWGRIGKIVSLLSALTVIAEIIGAPRLKQFGKSLHGKLTFQKVFNNIKKSFSALKLFWRALSADKQEQDDLTDEFLYKTPVGFITLILAWVGIVFTFNAYWSRGFWSVLGHTFLLLLLVWLVGPPIVALALSLPMLVLLILDLFFIEPLAWVLEREPIDKLVKAGSIILLVIGFHFDLLAS